MDRVDGPCPISSFVTSVSDGRFAKNENDTIRFASVSHTTQTIRFDSVQPNSRYLIDLLIFVKPVNDNVYVSISPVCL